MLLPLAAEKTSKTSFRVPHTNRERIQSILTNTIETLNVLNNLVPLTLAQGVLSAISGILGIIKNTMNNDDDFRGLADQCEKIGLIIWRATSGTSEGQLSKTLEDALSQLQKSVNRIYGAVMKKLQKGLDSRAFHVVLNQEIIDDWQSDLDHALSIFNAELSISTNMKLDQLMALLQTTAILQVEPPLPEQPPVQPANFVGRSELVRITVKHLLGAQHVALIGSGGIGKTSISRVVLNNDAIMAKFTDHRYFVRFDDIDASQVNHGTFLDRIAKAMGFSPSKLNSHALISKLLSTFEVLLVLDNAETFLDAACDAGQIAASIDEFGARSNVSIMLTSRNTGLPSNLKWQRLRVPVLEVDEACQAFKAIYSPPFDHSILIRLLASVDFHPLSINLLAQVAVQNGWSPAELVASWDRRHALLLNNGIGKTQSIAVMIELSLNSPSIKNLGSTARELLQVIALLPQGISTFQLVNIFPAIPTIESCAESLCKHSLAYYKDGFITLLAPIRLYISDRYNTLPSKIPLLEKVQSYYESHIDELVEHQEDVNLEHLIALRLADATTMKYSLNLATQFIYSLLENKPRPSALYPTVSALRPEDSTHSTSYINIFRQHNKAIMIAKGECLNAIVTLMLWLGQVQESQAVLVEAQSTLNRCGSAARAALTMADICIGTALGEHGNYKLARGLYESALRRFSSPFRRSAADRILKGLVNLCLSVIFLAIGEPGATEMALSTIPTLKPISSPNYAVAARLVAGYAEMYNGNLQRAREYFHTALYTTTEKDLENCLNAHVAAAELALRQGEQEEAKALCEQLQYLVRKAPSGATLTSSAKICVSMYLITEGDISQARKLMTTELANAIGTGRIEISTVKYAYAAAHVELIAGELDMARQLFLKTTELCTGLAEFIYRARAERALGEIAVLADDFPSARLRFEETKRICGLVGVTPNVLYRGAASFPLDDSLSGWVMFQESRLPLHSADTKNNDFLLNNSWT